MMCRKRHFVQKRQQPAGAAHALRSGKDRNALVSAAKGDGTVEQATGPPPQKSSRAGCTLPGARRPPPGVRCRSGSACGACERCEGLLRGGEDQVVLPPAGLRLAVALRLPFSKEQKRKGRKQRRHSRTPQDIEAGGMLLNYSNSRQFGRCRCMVTIQIGTRMLLLQADGGGHSKLVQFFCTVMVYNRHRAIYYVTLPCNLSNVRATSRGEHAWVSNKLGGVLRPPLA